MLESESAAAAEREREGDERQQRRRRGEDPNKRTNEPFGLLAIARNSDTAKRVFRLAALENSKTKSPNEKARGASAYNLDLFRSLSRLFAALAPHASHTRICLPLLQWPSHPYPRHSMSPSTPPSYAPALHTYANGLACTHLLAALVQWRDVRAILLKTFHVVIPFIPQSKGASVTRDWDLWGPLLYCFTLALYVLVVLSRCRSRHHHLY